MARFASHFVLAVLSTFLLSAALAENPAVVDSIDTTARLAYVPKFCYKRVQICCYKYFPCGHFCKLYKCKIFKKCIRYKYGKCIKHKIIKICIHRCYTKLCLRWRCGPFVIKGKKFSFLKKTKLSKKFTIKKKTH